jgi:hypothetical protein
MQKFKLIPSSHLQRFFLPVLRMQQSTEVAKNRFTAAANPIHC